MVAIDPKIVFGEEWDELVARYVAELRGSMPITGREIALPGDDRIKCYKKREDEK